MPKKKTGQDKAENKTTQFKAMIRPSLMAEVKNFVDSQKVVPTQADLCEYALRFYMESFRASGKVVNEDRYPLVSAAGEINIVSVGIRGHIQSVAAETESTYQGKKEKGEPLDQDGRKKNLPPTGTH